MRRLVAFAVAAASLAPAATHASAPVQPVVYAFTRAASAFGPGTEDVAAGELILPSLVVPQGGRLEFVNLSIWGHSIYSDDWHPVEDRRLFRSEVVPFRGQSTVAGVSDLAPATYGFFCSNHIGMRGELTIVPTLEQGALQ